MTQNYPDSLLELCVNFYLRPANVELQPSTHFKVYIIVVCFSCITNSSYIFPWTEDDSSFMSP